MKTLITEAEVATLAFSGGANVKPELITPAAIMASQQRFLRPLLGALYTALEQDKYPELLDEWVKPVLAQWVKYSIMPAIAAQVGRLGLVQFGGADFECADDKAVVRLIRRLHADAMALSRAMIIHIETSGNLYPEYDPRENVVNRISITGGIVL